jgi:excinuclease ABC subunit B
MEIIRDFRKGEFDVLIGINLLREGLDLPEVSLVAILDADKEGFLRSETSLVQTIGRAARNVNGKVIMYADHITASMRYAIDETNRRRLIQEAYNKENGIEPQSIIKGIRDVIEATVAADAYDTYQVDKIKSMNKKELADYISELEEEMFAASRTLQFERAAELRDMIVELKTMKVKN